MMEPVFCFVRESYFVKNRNFIKMLDCGDTKKQSRRTHLRIKIDKGGNHVYVNGCIKSAKKKRHEKEPLYRESSFINFLPEMGILK